MEERALYHAILAAPHDDAARLVYADWLDENASSLPGPLAKSERARAEFIRVQCAIARSDAGGWKASGTWQRDPALLARERRLLFHNGKKWRRAFPRTLASSPFDRGFLRPFRAMRPQEFLEQLPSPQLPIRPPLPPLPYNSPARRYVPEMGSTLRACPLWDVHLFASQWHNDPLADRGQYAELLAEVGRSPLLERAGWLKVSFFGTPVYDFLRYGNFANVETLVLNAGPFPDVLEAVTENESFRSLRYVYFGFDQWAWAGGYPQVLRYTALMEKLRAANERHVPFGEMRGILRAILRDTPLPPAAPPPAPAVPAPAPRTGFAASSPGEQTSPEWRALVLVALLCAVVFKLWDATKPFQAAPVSPTFKFDYNPDRYEIPPMYDLMPKAKADAPGAKPDPRPEQPKGFVGPPEPERGDKSK